MTEHLDGVEWCGQKAYGHESRLKTGAAQDLGGEEREMTRRLEASPVFSPEGVPVSGRVRGLDPESSTGAEKVSALNQKGQGIVQMFNNVAGGDVLKTLGRERRGV